MALVKRTLADLRDDLAPRLGFGSSTLANARILDSFLRDAQETLYWETNWKSLKTYQDVTLAADATTLAYPQTGGVDTFHEERIIKVAAFDSSEWYDLKDGIETKHYTFQAYPGNPLRYELYYDSIEIWPKSDKSYSMRVWGIKPLGRFTENDDKATLDSGMIFTYALAMAKAHYRQPDWQIYENKMNTLVSRIRGKSFGNKVFPRQRRERPPWPRSLVEGRDV